MNTINCHITTIPLICNKLEEISFINLTNDFHFFNIGLIWFPEFRRQNSFIWKFFKLKFFFFKRSFNCTSFFVEWFLQLPKLDLILFEIFDIGHFYMYFIKKVIVTINIVLDNNICDDMTGLFFPIIMTLISHKVRFYKLVYFTFLCNFFFICNW